MCLCVYCLVENLGEWRISFFSVNFRERERERQKRDLFCFVFLFVCFSACLRIECRSKSLQFCGCAKSNCRETCIVFSILRVLGFEKIVSVFYFCEGLIYVFLGHLVPLLCSCAWRGFSAREAVQTARGRN